MDLLEKICKELGVEVGKEWLGNDGNYYRITSDGDLRRVIYSDNLEEDSFEYLDNIQKILTGELKPKWKPKEGEKYYMPKPTHKEERHRFMKFTFSLHEYDKWAFENNLVYKTEKEAIECANAMLELAKSYKEEI